MPEADDMLEINRTYWDAAAEVHGNGDDKTYDLAGLLAGQDTLTAVEDAVLREATPSVAGLDVLHVQCHIGFETISLARRGATVTGVDLSPASLRKAEKLATRCGVRPSFVEADANALPEELWGRFDLAYASIGVLHFAPDPTVWMRSVARCLRPGGRLVLVEYHALPNMFEEFDPARAWCAYDDAGPHDWDGPETGYADPAQAPAATRVVFCRHGVGAVATAACRAGLRLLSVGEHTDNDRPGEYGSFQEADGRWRSRIGGQPVPLLFSIVARRDPDPGPS
ncbi:MULTISPECIES: class I SAM-dependent methyltransferase [Streptomyces]|uniref:class I SAM-dependent methyltransferase n=1 Tax=Streptomyces TaxID=1883 RepID=UPI0004CA851D|nr:MULTISPECIES: class I SAM-dependent methyltransferase [Streptomyces]